jgi:acyl-CoA thioesterase FadM
VPVTGEQVRDGALGAYLSSTAHFTTRPNDLDSLGHVNHAIALEYLEAGRWDWLAINGLRHTGVVTPVVLRAEIDYRQEIFAGPLSIATQMLTAPDELTYRATFHQTITINSNASNLRSVAVAVEARIITAFLETSTRRLCAYQEFLESNRVARPARSNGHVEISP